MITLWKEGRKTLQVVHALMRVSSITSNWQGDQTCHSAVQHVSIPGQKPPEENVLPWRVTERPAPVLPSCCCAAGGQLYWSTDLVVPGLGKKYCLGG